PYMRFCRSCPYRPVAVGGADWGGLAGAELPLDSLTAIRYRRPPGKALPWCEDEEDPLMLVGFRFALTGSAALWLASLLLAQPPSLPPSVPAGAPAPAPVPMAEAPPSRDQAAARVNGQII